MVVYTCTLIRFLKYIRYEGGILFDDDWCHKLEAIVHL